MTAKSLIREGAILRGTGGVEARIGPLVLHADEGTLNPETGELDLRGHAGVTLPARPDHTLFRFESRALVTDQEVTVVADRLHVKNSTLEGSGHVQIQAVNERLQADQIEMYLKTADARVRGNIQAPEPHRGYKDFPPEIVK